MLQLVLITGIPGWWYKTEKTTNEAVKGGGGSFGNLVCYDHIHYFYFYAHAQCAIGLLVTHPLPVGLIFLLLLHLYFHLTIRAPCDSFS